MIYLIFLNSYTTWKPSKMKNWILQKCIDDFGKVDPQALLHRSYLSMYIEWWIHNIGYYMTLPLCCINVFKNINHRCKDLDLEDWGHTTE